LEEVRYPSYFLLLCQSMGLCIRVCVCVCVRARRVCVCSLFVYSLCNYLTCIYMSHTPRSVSLRILCRMRAGGLAYPRSPRRLTAPCEFATHPHACMRYSISKEKERGGWDTRISLALSVTKHLLQSVKTQRNSLGSSGRNRITVRDCTMRRRRIF